MPAKTYAEVFTIQMSLESAMDQTQAASTSSFSYMEREQVACELGWCHVVTLRLQLAVRMLYM